MASVTGAKPVTTSDNGEVMLFSSASPDSSPASLSSCQAVRIDMESLPTGMAMPSSGHSSMPTACTASYSAWFSPTWSAALIQLAESLISESRAIGAAARLVMVSATARRALAAGSISATGGRSPMAMASPAWVS